MESKQKSRRDIIKLGAGLTLGSAAVACQKMPSFSINSKLDTIEILHARRSVRKFKPTPVPEEHLTRILGAARMAPTAGNQQPWKFLVIRDKNKINELKAACIKNSMDWYKENQNPTEEQVKERHSGVTEYYNGRFSAPVFVVVLTDNESQNAGYNHHDGPLAAGYLLIAARSFGYGTVYYTDSIPDAVTKQVLNIPDRYTRVCITPIGVPEQWPETPDKKPLEEIVAYGVIS
ncbi:nitroreductase family protein [candidate division KSB1 bacterium]|nr:nitroreductase family protein [candidate division KSB1 bacterium]